MGLKLEAKCIVHFLALIVFSAFLFSPLLSAQGSGFNVAGRIESGHLQVGESVLVLPANEIASVRGK